MVWGYKTDIKESLSSHITGNDCTLSHDHRDSDETARKQSLNASSPLLKWQKKMEKSQQLEISNYHSPRNSGSRWSMEADWWYMILRTSRHFMKSAASAQDHKDKVSGCLWSHWLSHFPLYGVSCSLVSRSLLAHGLQPARLLCPWSSPGRNTGVGCHFLLLLHTFGHIFGHPSFGNIFTSSYFKFLTLIILKTLLSLLSYYRQPPPHTLKFRFHNLLLTQFKNCQTYYTLPVLRKTQKWP